MVWHDLSGAPDSGIGRSEDSMTCGGRVGRFGQSTFQPTFPQPIRCKRRAGGRVVTVSDVGLDVRSEGAMWGMPRKRALFGPEGQDSVSSVSDVAEGRSEWPLDDESTEEVWSLGVDMADVVARLQEEVEEFRRSGGVRIWWLQKVGDSPSALGLVQIYINAGTHVCGENKLGPIPASV